MKKIDPKKLSEIAQKKEPKEIEKAQGGKVITRILSKEDEDQRKRDTYVEWSDYTAHSEYTEHTKHGKSW